MKSFDALVILDINHISTPGGGRGCYVVTLVVAARELTWTQIPPRHYLCRQEVVLIGVRLPFMMVSLPTFLQGRHGLALCRPQSATVGVDVRRVWAADFSIDLEVTWWRWCLRRLGHGGLQF